MGRLILNVLLSFAQFEREVTDERIRDKIAASKRRGMWMGGVVPRAYGPPTDLSSSTLLKLNSYERSTGSIWSLLCIEAVGEAQLHQLSQ